MPNKIIYLHVGFLKTASSSIQATLDTKSNQKYIDSCDIEVIRFKKTSNITHPIYSAFCDNPHKYRNNLKNNRTQSYNIYNKNNLKILAHMLLSSPKKKILMSGEGISLLKRNSIHRLKTFIEKQLGQDIIFDVIIYVRNPVTWVTSYLQQFIRMGIIGNIEKYVNEKEFKDLYRSQIEKFISIFGKENVNIFSFEDSIKNNIVKHFLSHIGINDDIVNKFILAKTNESSSDEAIRIISNLNELYPNYLTRGSNITPFYLSDRYANQFIGEIIYPEIITKIDRYFPKHKFYLERNQLVKILADCREDLIWLRKHTDYDYCSGSSYIPKQEYKNREFYNLLWRLYLFIDLSPKYLRDYVIKSIQLTEKYLVDEKNNEPLHNLYDYFNNTQKRKEDHKMHNYFKLNYIKYKVLKLLYIISLKLNARGLNFILKKITNLNNQP